MGKLVVSEFMSLDGVIQDPQWTGPYWNDEIGRFKNEELFAADVQLLGRVTYEGFAAAWPGRTDEHGYADKFNSMPKYVVSATLDTAEWHNSAIIRDHFVEQIRVLKSVPNQDVLVFGSGDLVQFLMEHDLIDQFNLQLYPVVLGKGERLFRENHSAKLKLVSSQPTPTGVLLLVYERETASDGQH